MTNLKANRLLLDKRNTLAIDREHAFAVVWTGNNQELAAAIESCGENTIGVQFRTYSEKTAAQDIKTYSRRLQKLSPQWTFDGFRQHEIRGHVLTTTYVGVLSRCF